MLQSNCLELVIIVTIVKNTRATVKAFLFNLSIFSSCIITRISYWIKKEAALFKDRLRSEG